MADMMDDKYVNTNSDVAGLENLTKFDSFFVNRYQDGFVTGYSFVFLTKPSLFIFPYKPADGSDSLLSLAYENMTMDQFFVQFLAGEAMNQSDRVIAEQLSFFEGPFPSSYSRSNFMPLFTNKARGFTTIDITMDQQEAFQTKQGFRMPIPTFKTQSEASGTLSIPMFETPNLDLTKTLGLWVNYISNVTDGTFHANPQAVKAGVIDYMSSMYYFVLEPDGKTLKYWAKYTGCWPTTVPLSQLSYRRGEPGIVEMEAQFVYTSKEDMSVAILEDFNRVSLDIVQASRQAEQLDYLSSKRSQLLERASLKSNPNYDAQSRNPVVFYKEGASAQSTNAGQLSDKFELSFGISTYADTFVDNKFGGEYYFDTADFFKSKLEE
jgi:hypothetical protein